MVLTIVSVGRQMMEFEAIGVYSICEIIVSLVLLFLFVWRVVFAGGHMCGCESVLTV